MKRLVVILPLVLAGCGAFATMRRADRAKAEKAFHAAVSAGDGTKASKIAKKARLDRRLVIDAVYAEMISYVMDDNVLAALLFSREFGLEKKDQVRFAQTAFDAMVRGGSCERAADIVRVFDLGPKYGEGAVLCVERTDAFKAALMACVIPVRDGFKRERVESAWTMTEIQKGAVRYALAEPLIDLCPLGEDRAVRWFASALADPDGLASAHQILKVAAREGWTWDFQGRYQALFRAVLAFGDERMAAEVIGDDAFAKSDDDVDAYLDFLAKRLQCLEAARYAKDLPSYQARVEKVFAHPKCVGASFEELAWGLPDGEAVAKWWFALALRHGKVRLARQLTSRQPDKIKAEAEVEKAALAVRDFDALMDFPPATGETTDQYRERMLGTILGLDEEWFVTRWVAYAYVNGAVSEAYRNGWIERAYLNALFRKDWRMAADVIHEHTVASKAELGILVAFEEAMRAEDADVAIELARAYKLDDDCKRRAALLKFRKDREAERAKLKKKRKKRPAADDDWNP